MAQTQITGTANVKRKITRAKRKVQNSMNARGRGSRQSEGGISDISEKIKEILPDARSMRGWGRYFRSAEAVVPIAIGALVVGVAAGVTAAVFAPRLRNSELFSNLGSNVQSAAEKLGEVLQQAKSQVLGATKGESTSEETHTPTV